MPKAKILIVDDDPDFVAYTRTVLESARLQSGQRGQQRPGHADPGREKPDLVVLDVIMSSVLDGLSMSQRMADDAALQARAGRHGHLHRQHGLPGALPDRREHPHRCLSHQTDRAGGAAAPDPTVVPVARVMRDS